MAAAVHVYLLCQPLPRVPPPLSAASSTRSLFLAMALPPPAFPSPLLPPRRHLPTTRRPLLAPSSDHLLAVNHEARPLHGRRRPSTGKHGCSRWRSSPSSSPEHYALKASTTPPRAQVQSSPELQIQRTEAEYQRRRVSGSGWEKKKVHSSFYNRLC
ncbi:uncharacterized protein LOC119322522 [Triticum dicoccoides]|uniref:uncharacterized protein LOC119322522 n=1 Tax=Triticum dicoccoides TaxID=85692 RepID=UPI0018915C15|nr:uncharacterized protein LOC119322522 [Triticum dicoccoides]